MAQSLIWKGIMAISRLADSKKTKPIERNLKIPFIPKEREKRVPDEKGQIV